MGAAEKGKSLYLTHCARCHGETGGPQKRIRAINSKNYLKAVDDTSSIRSSSEESPERGWLPWVKKKEAH